MGRSLALRDLVLVMGEDEIHAPAVDIERVPKELHRHRGAFDVPPRSSRTPRAVPKRLPRFCRFPECKIQRIFFPFVRFNTGPGPELVRFIRNIFRRFRLPVRLLDAQPVHVFVICREIPFYDLGPGLALPVRTLDDLIIDIRKISDELDPVFFVPQIPPDHVEGDSRACMAEMAAVVDSHAADIHTDPAAAKRLKKLFLTCKCIVDFDSHRPL